MHVDTTATQCPGDPPASTAVCETLPVGATCDDNHSSTTNDVCVGTTAVDAVCAGKVRLASAMKVPVEVSALAAGVIPDPLPPDPTEAEIAEKHAQLESNPIANAAQASISDALEVSESSITITDLSVSGNRRRLLSQGGIAVAYVVALSPAEATAAQ